MPTKKTTELKPGDNLLFTFAPGGLTVRTAKGRDGVDRVRVIAPAKEDPSSPPSGDNPPSTPSGLSEPDTRPADGPTPATELDAIRAATDATGGEDESSAATAAAVIAKTTVTEPTQARTKTTKPQAGGKVI